jgi:sulfur-carrier protein
MFIKIKDDMTHTILFFGQLTDITGVKQLEVKNIEDTEALTQHLLQIYPSLEESKYILAIDNHIVTKPTLLNDKSTVALLPPFSGG